MITSIRHCLEQILARITEKISAYIVFTQNKEMRYFLSQQFLHLDMYMVRCFHCTRFNSNNRTFIFISLWNLNGTVMPVQKSWTEPLIYTSHNSDQTCKITIKTESSSSKICKSWRWFLNLVSVFIVHFEQTVTRKTARFRTQYSSSQKKKNRTGMDFY